MADESSEDPTSSLLSKFWDTAQTYFDNDERSEAEPREAVKGAAAELFGFPDAQAVYVAKATQSGYRNQVWQGQAISRANDVMVLINKTGSGENIAEAARSRLHPLTENGFDSVIICEPDSSGWKVRGLAEYEHVGLAEELQKTKIGSFEIIKLPDPAAADFTPLVDEKAYDNAGSTTELSAHLLEAKNLVLAGPPGTSKTHQALKIVDQFAGGPAEPCRLETVLNGRAWHDVPVSELQTPNVVWEFIQLHPSYTYEDFVRGLRTDPNGKGFSLVSVDGILPIISHVAAVRRGKPTILIIDELNRCNLATVFGETLFAIDPAQRGRSIRLQYEGSGVQSDALRIPPELLVLATMNTADRSISAVDFALRRRFRFLFLGPSEQSLKEFYGSQGERAAATISILRQINSIVPDKEIQVGHSYFMIDGGLDIDTWVAELANKITHEVRPLLREYDEEERLSHHGALSFAGIEIDLLRAPEISLFEPLCTAIKALISNGQE